MNLTIKDRRLLSIFCSAVLILSAAASLFNSVLIFACGGCVFLPVGEFFSYYSVYTAIRYTEPHILGITGGAVVGADCLVIGCAIAIFTFLLYCFLIAFSTPFVAKRGTGALTVARNFSVSLIIYQVIDCSLLTLLMILGKSNALYTVSLSYHTILIAVSVCLCMLYTLSLREAKSESEELPDGDDTVPAPDSTSGE